MESTIVIKVKYGETLRRFNARVNEAGRLDLDMGGLREKVLSLFNFASDVDLTLTYIDEDGDIVTFVDEEDLHDVMRQSLNPLRISVKLNSDKGGRSYTRSSGSSTPMRSPRVQYPLPNLNSGVSEFLKSVPEPFREALSKLSLDFVSRPASSTPGLAELFDSFSKLGQSYINPLSEFQAGTESSAHSGAAGNPMGASMTKGPEASKDDGATSEAMPNTKFEEPTYKTKASKDDGTTSEVMPNTKSEEPTCKTNKKVDLGKGIKDVDASVTPTSGPMNLNASLPGDSFPSGFISANPASVDAFCGSKEEVNMLRDRKAKGIEWENFKSVESNFPTSDNKEARKSNEPWKSVGSGFFASTADSKRNSAMDSKNTNLGGSTSTTMFPNLNLINECPFAGIPVASDSAVPPLHYGSRVLPLFKRGYNHSEGMGGIFHRGVSCDGCGVHPITGPRFKSKVKDNYDLCSICFSEMGNDTDYIRMDRPVSHRHPHSFKGFYDPNSRVRPPPLHHVLRAGGMKPCRPKLESRFILDVNVMDGTVMTPSTPFTKIWRMRNNGNVVWPQGTQLMWIGGDKLSNAISVELQISSNGLPVDNELDVAVDFTAPELPGQYTSYWRMASPSGQKFGQRVWVLIQVDASLKDSLYDSFNGLNLNLPPASSGITGPEMVNMPFEPVVDSFPAPNNPNRAKDLVEPIVYSHPNKDQEQNFPINDTLLVGGGVSNPVTPVAPATVSYPVIDLSEVAPALPSPSADVVLLPKADVVPSPKADVEQTLLRELEEMGFKQIDLNKEILRMNEYDLEQSVDDLCGVAEWDPILEELQEMGFCDKETNKRLLQKNNGSIKRVVMDLIAGEKM
ncbi:hypothetical protein ACSBR2_023880 [Camellia fascicularis]